MWRFYFWSSSTSTARSDTSAYSSQTWRFTYSEDPIGIRKVWCVPSRLCAFLAIHAYITAIPIACKLFIYVAQAYVSDYRCVAIWPGIHLLLQIIDRTTCNCSHLCSHTNVSVLPWSIITKCWRATQYYLERLMPSLLPCFWQNKQNNVLCTRSYKSQTRSLETLASWDTEKLVQTFWQKQQRSLVSISCNPCTIFAYLLASLQACRHSLMYFTNSLMLFTIHWWFSLSTDVV